MSRSMFNINLQLQNQLVVPPYNLTSILQLVPWEGICINIIIIFKCITMGKENKVKQEGGTDTARS